VETDLHGNTYQLRTLRDGTTHRVLKNFPTERELIGMLEGAATVTAYRTLQNFWLLEYRLHAA
jgi:demethylmenaquinone methyltransferase/2-methoxy-6-polyprenyl-1,4-benzoquinol methylase